MSQSIPKFHETFIPILKVLAGGKELHYEEMKRIVRDTFRSLSQFRGIILVA
jgi:hypothetical protein